jgi:hypothetical protein
MEHPHRSLPMATTLTVRTRKPERTRTVRVCCFDPEARSGLIRIDMDGLSDHYHIRQVPADEGTGYRVQKCIANEDGSTTLNEPYHVLLNGTWSQCACMGFCHRGTCRHIEALTALAKARKLS